jgi:amino acid transporter
LLFAGIEVSAVHANEVKNPKRDYPKAIFLAAIIIILTFTLGSLAIASVLPASTISLTAGLMQGFKELLAMFHLSFLLPIIGLLVAFGAIGGVAAWIIGPSKGLFATAKAGDIPPFLEKTNRNNVPTHILLIQGTIVTFLTCVFLLVPTVSTALFMLTALTAILYLMMYILLYASAIRLRYTQPNVKRSYKIPGGNFGMWLVGGVGILGALFAIIVGLFPPQQLAVGSPIFYVLFLIVGIIVFLGTPVLMIHARKPSWKLKNDHEKNSP